MDINGTRFHLVLGAEDWARCRSVQTVYQAARGEVTLAPLPFLFPAPAGAQPDPLASRRGAGRDRYGNTYWIDDGGAAVRVLSSGSDLASDFWPVPVPERSPREGAFRSTVSDEPVALRFGGLAVTTDHYLLVGTLDVPGLLVFDLHAGGPPEHRRWPAGVPFAPFDIGAGPDGGAWILDRDQGRLWGLDRHLAVLPSQPLGPPPPSELFRPASGAPDDVRPPPPRFPTGAALDAGSPVDAVDPVAVEVLPDGTVLILDRSAGRVVRYRDGARIGEAQLTVAPSLDRPLAQGETLVGADFVVLAAGAGGASGSGGAGRVLVPAADGQQVFAFDAEWDAAALSLRLVRDEYLPMRLFGGKALVSAGGLAWYDVGADRWSPVAEQPRPRYHTEGTLLTDALDGREPACVWHRLVLDGCIPALASVTVESRAAENVPDLATLPWTPEPAPRRRASGSELPFVSAPTGADAGSFELLFQRARGRYLQLRLTLRGAGRTSPRLRALRVWYPRFSYLHRYLPALYRDDAESASFLDRYLANLEGMFTGVQDRVRVAELLLDPRAAPAEALDWLADFFGVALDPAWDEARRRLFLQNAMRFFALRGTATGVVAALRLALEPCADEHVFDVEPHGVRSGSIRVVERFRLRRVPAAALGTADAGDGIREVTPQARFTPDQGGEVLHARYRDALAAAGLPSGPGLLFPARDPGGAQSAVWQQVAADALGFLPDTSAAAQEAFRRMLERRYRDTGALTAAWKNGPVSSFSEVMLPTALPPDGAALADWYLLQTLVLPMRRAAHRFTVMLPVPASEAFAVELHQQRKALAERIVELEKPAHTRFDVRFYWAMFRAGEARLGFDTQLDKGSRAPDLMPQLVLDRGFLAEARLAGSPGERFEERQMIPGRDVLALRHTTEERKT